MRLTRALQDPFPLRQQHHQSFRGAQQTAERPRCYDCGPTGLVETAASQLLDLGHDADRFKTERFGPSGG